MARPYLPGYTLDYTVGAFIVRNKKVLLIDHKGLGSWLCVGGHIEPNEDPIEAVLREAKEETGLEDVRLQGQPYSNFDCKDRKSLICPRWMDKHLISEGTVGIKDNTVPYRHEHIALYYVAYSINGEVNLEVDAHNGIRWFTSEELDALDRIPDIIRFYAKEALKNEMTFTIDNEELQKAAAFSARQKKKLYDKQMSDPAFVTKHGHFMRDGEPYTGAIGGMFTYTFHNTSLGQVRSIVDEVTGEKEDLTNFEDW